MKLNRQGRNQMDNGYCVHVSESPTITSVETIIQAACELARKIGLERQSIESMVSAQFKGMLVFIHSTYVFQLFTVFHNSRLTFTSRFFEVAHISPGNIMQIVHLHSFDLTNTSQENMIPTQQVISRILPPMNPDTTINTSNNDMTPSQVFEPIFPPMNPSLLLPLSTNVPTTNIIGHLSDTLNFDKQVCL